VETTTLLITVDTDVNKGFCVQSPRTSLCEASKGRQGACETIHLETFC